MRRTREKKALSATAGAQKWIVLLYSKRVLSACAYCNACRIRISTLLTPCDSFVGSFSLFIFVVFLCDVVTRTHKYVQRRSFSSIGKWVYICLIFRERIAYVCSTWHKNSEFVCLNVSLNELPFCLTLNLVPLMIRCFCCCYFCLNRIQSDISKHMMPGSFMPHLYQDLPPIGNKLKAEGNASAHSGSHSSTDLHISTSMIPSFGSKLGLLLPDPAPDVAPNPEKMMSTAANTQLGAAPMSMQFKRIKINDTFRCLCLSNELMHSFRVFCFFFLFWQQTKWLTQVWRCLIQMSHERRNTQKKHGPGENRCSAACNKITRTHIHTMRIHRKHQDVICLLL